MKDNNNSEIKSTVKCKNKFFTKDKICFFAVGLLLGATIASGAFLIYINVNGNNNSAMTPRNGTPPSTMNGGTPPEMPKMSDGEMPDGNTPPELPDGETQNDGTPPELPNSETPSDI